jgi:hypothetical protein
VLAPDPTDDAGPWDELPLPALGDSILYVHRDVLDLGRAVQAHLSDPGGPGAPDPGDPSTGPPPGGGAGPAPERTDPAGGGEGFVPDDPLGLYRSHPPFPSAWSNSKFFTANTFEGQGFGDRLMAGTMERLTPAQTGALRAYTTGIGYRDINGALPDEASAGEPVPTNIPPIVTDLDQAFDTATPLDRDVVVVRAESPSGLGVSQESELPRLLGTERRNPRYTSTTMGAWPPLWGGDRPVVVRLRVPAGTKALYMGPFSTAHHEVELLLPRGLTTRIIGVRSEFSTTASVKPREIWFVDMEVTGTPPISP